MSRTNEPVYPPELKKLLVETHLEKGLTAALEAVYEKFPQFKNRLTRMRASALSYNYRSNKAKKNGTRVELRRRGRKGKKEGKIGERVAFTHCDNRLAILDEVWQLRKERHLTSKAIRAAMEKKYPNIVFPGPLQLLSSAKMRASGLAREASGGEQLAGEGQGGRDYFIEIRSIKSDPDDDTLNTRKRVSSATARQILKLLWRV